MPRSLTSHVDHPKKVGARLVELRRRAGLSQRRLADGLCTSAYISRVEGGERVPSLQLLSALATRLGVTTEYLATGIDVAGGSDVALVDAELALRLGDLDEAERLFGQHLDGGAAARVGALAGLGRIAFQRGETLRSIELLEESLGAQPLLAAPHVVDTLGRAYASSGAYEAATALLSRAFDASRAAEAPLEVLRFGVLLANALTDSGQFQAAESTLATVIEQVEAINDPTAAARVYWTQSRLHVLRGEARLGARYAQRAIDILERAEDESYTAMAYHLLAYAEVEAGAPEEALAHLARGRELFGARFGDFDEAKFSLEEARALLALRRMKAAAKAASRALTVIDALEPGDRGRAYVVLGDVFAATGGEDRAEELWRLALDFLLDTGKPYAMEAATRLSTLLEERGEEHQALAVLKRAVQVSRSAAETSAQPSTAQPSTA